MRITTRRADAADVEVARRLRLAALAEAPHAFASSLQDELAMDAAAWQARLASNAQGLRTVGFFAVDDGLERGLVVGVRVLDEPETAELVSLWVEPALRGRGAGRALVESVCAWAQERGCHRVVLSVTADNHPALRLYRACGFEETGQRHPFVRDPSIDLVEMARPVPR